MDLMREFLNEAEEQLNEFERLVLELEESGPGGDRINSLFRIAHTLKGSAACVGLKPVAEFAHRMESLLDAVRSGRAQVNQNVCSLLLKAGDVLRAMVLKGEGVPGENEVLQELESALNPSASLGGSTGETLRLLVRVALDSNATMRAARAYVILKRLEELGEIEFAKPAETELVRGDVVPDEVVVELKGKAEGREVYEAVAGCAEVKEVDVRHLVQARGLNWEEVERRCRELASLGKKVVCELEPAYCRLDGAAIRFIRAALENGWMLFSKEEVARRVLSRFRLA
ncbi:MAG: hypothetical protein PWQ86_1127 [Bacillota bacterium]|nr:hypothetical protein [Bacillota bacterium]MDK2960467.1 hypothetical protein [Bacillota bacterium]